MIHRKVRQIEVNPSFEDKVRGELIRATPQRRPDHDKRSGFALRRAVACNICTKAPGTMVSAGD
jgi:hypothetical protein